MTDYDTASTFWAAQLQGAKRTVFPAPARDATSTTATASVESILRAAWAVVLARYCDTDDVCFGVVAAAAAASGREALPVRVRLHPQQRVSDLLSDIQAQAAEMAAHGRLDLVQSIAKLGPEAREACDFTNILLITSSTSSGSSELSAVASSFKCPLITEITLLDDNDSAKLNFAFDPSTLSEFQAGALSRHLGHVVQQLATHGDEPISSLSLAGPWDLEQAVQWCGRKSERVPSRLHDLVAEQVLRRPECEAIYAWDGVLSYAELDALSGQLACQLGRLGVGVAGHGRTTMVPVCFEKSLWAIVAMLGVIKAGGAWVPLNPEHPASRLEEIVSSVDARVVLVSPTTAKSCAGIAEHVVEVSAASLLLSPVTLTQASRPAGIVSKVDAVVTTTTPVSLTTKAKDGGEVTETIVELSYATSNASSESLGHGSDATNSSESSEHGSDVTNAAEPTPDDAAYVIFTSGSTGKPKGIVVEHGAVCASIRGQEREYGITPSSRVLQFSSYVFDACIADIWLTLAAGGTVCIPSEARRLEDAAGFMREARVNVGMALTPSFMATLDPDSVPGLALLLVAAEAPTRETIATWQPRVGCLLNGYGPTETVVMCTYHEYTAPDDHPTTIGRNFTGRGWIVDADNHDRLAPIGCVGELLMESSGLARGYLNDPAKTQAAFLPHVGWWPTDLLGPSNRFYKTGDLVRFNPDGTIAYLGRKDTQVKVRGQRVELGEIEHRIRATTLASIAQVAVDVVRRETGDLLAAWMSFDDDDTHDYGTAEGVDNFLPMDAGMRERMAGLAAELRASLPSYMVPAVFLPLRSMLFNTSMKIDRVSLRASVDALGSGLGAYYSLALADDAQDDDDGEPLTPTESKLRELWSQVLKAPSRSITKNTAFLQIGGDSISAIRLVNLARKAGIRLEIASIFADSRLSRIAATAKVEEHDAALLEPDRFSLLPSEEVDGLLALACEQCGLSSRDAVEDVYPCTPLQEGLMALSMKQPGSYVASFAYKLPAHVDLDRFRAAWHRTVERCSNLRTRIALIGGRSVQVIAREGTGWHASSTEAEEASDWESTQSALQSIPMSYGSPLCRYAIATRGEEHYVVLALHHAVYDGWSFRLMMDTLKAQYQAQVAAPHQVATPTEIPSFSRFIRYTLGLDPDAAASYWKTQLHGAKKTAFPAAAPRDASTPVTVTQQFSATIEIPRAAAGTAVTRASVLRAAWAVVLARYCDTDDVCFAVTVSGRQAPVAGLDAMAGPVIATVPVRVRLDDPRQTVAGFLGRIQAQAAEMAAHEQYGLQNIAKVSADARGACDFANLMVVQPAQVADDDDDDDNAGLRLRPAAAGVGGVSGEGVADFFNYPLMAEFVLLHDGRARLNFTFDASAVSAFQLDALSRHLNHVVGQLVAPGQGQNQPLGALSLAGPWDLQQAVQFSGVSKPAAARTRLEDLVAEQARRTPDAEAIFSWDGCLTYRELDADSTRLAGHLRTLGVGPSVMVPICFEKSKWAVVAMVAVVKAGGAWVPLNPQHPPSRLRTIVEDVSAPMVLVSPSTAATCRGLTDQIVEVSTASLSNLPEVDETAAAVRPAEATPDDVAYLIFTSGSTGKPKGIVVQQWALCTSIRCQIAEYQTGPQTRTLQFANYVFDACIADIFVALCSGGTVCVPSEAQRLQDVAGFIRAAGINTAIGLTPSFAATIPPAACPGLATIVLGAEAVTREALDLWFGRAALYNTYGPTETLVMCTSYRYAARGEAPGTIGRLFTGRAWVVEAADHHRLAPVGCVGELLVESTPMARGYLHDEAKTRGAFIDHVAWWAATGLDDGGANRFYKTGDLVRFRGDGMLCYVGRKDTQVKIRGQRIELGEIEHAVRRGLPDAEQVAVELVRREAGDALVAFFTLADHAEDREGGEDNNILAMTDAMRQRFAALTSKLRAALPSYMIPSLFLPLRSMLFNASMKIDRLALRASAQVLGEGLSAYSSVQDDHVEPSTPMELRLRELWAGVLKIPARDIKKNSEFLQIGGDSIGAIRLVTLARQEGISLDVATIFQDSRLSHLATTASICEETAAASPDVPEPFTLLPGSEVGNVTAQAREQCGLSADEDIEDIYPCTALQEGLMALTHKQPGSYVASFVHRVPAEADLDLDKFRSAWERTVELCSNLRTRIALVQGRSVQVVVRRAEAWQVAGTPDLESARALLDGAAMGYGTPLCRAAVAVGPNGDYHLALAIHHATYDGWGFQLVLEKLQAIYHGSTLSALPPYSLFIKHTQAMDRDAASRYWTEQLRGAKHSGYPLIGRAVDPAKSVTQTFEAAIPLPRSTGTSITKASVLRAAWALVLARHCDLDDACFAMTVSGRQAPVPGLDNMSGPTIATVPVRVRLDPNQSVADFLQGIQAQASEMATYEQYGLHNISKINSDAREVCDFTNLIVIQPAPAEASDDSAKKTILLPAKSARSSADKGLEGFFNYPLITEMVLQEVQAKLNFTYDASILSEFELHALSQQLSHVVQQLSSSSAHGEQPLSKVTLASPWDLDQAMKWSGEKSEVVHARLEEVVSRQAERGPDREAIYAWDGRLSYAQLDALSSQLARYLRCVGVGPNVMVPICFEKSLWTIVAMLGVVKAGGAFVPLNPEHPPPRLQSVVSDVNARVMLVSATTAKTCADIACRLLEVSAASLSGLVQRADEIDAAASVPTAQPVLTPGEVAYIIFTSGSTGKPKGIVVEHGPLCSSIRSQARDFGIAADSRVLQFSSYVFDACIADIFVTLCSGGTVCVPSDADRLQNIAGFIREARVNTAIALTPSFVATINPDEVPTLQKLFVGAEAPTKETLSTWFDRLHLRNVYGPTETVMICMSYHYQSVTESPLTIGRPFTARLWIVDPDDHNKLAPIGCVGELLVEGTTLVKGYLNDPVKTNASFIDSVDWWPAEALGSKTRFYKTGDLVRFNTNGTVAYVGRKDTQVKVRGQRVELGEIEHTIRNTLADVEHVAVDVVRRDGDLLVAFVAFDDGLDESSAAAAAAADGEDPSSSPVLAMDEAMRQRFAGLGDKLRASLPPYMVPSLFIPLRAMLFNASMKMDRPALRALQRAAFEAPADALEAGLRRLWAQVLRVADEEDIGVLDDFYHLGGDSIRIVTLNKLVRKAHHVALTVRQMSSRAITVRSLAELVRAEREGAPVGAAPAVDLMAELATAMEALPVQLDGSLGASPITQLPDGATVLLTGATGYLGTEILKQLLRSGRKVVALVRATSPAHGLDRIKRSAAIAGWWNEDEGADAARVEVWPGDLARPRLGLDETSWARLHGDAGTGAGAAVDAVVHNGAVVNWNADFGMLRAANVQSTADLLGAVAASPRGAKLVYISGGLTGDTQADRAATAAQMGAGGNGYAQTKFLAESVVHEVAVRRLPGPHNRVSTVKPGMIIGGGAGGVCNIDDYLWRVVAAAVSLRAFPEEPADHWMPLASVETVARAAVRQLAAPGAVAPFVDLQSVGLPARAFWEVLDRELGVACRPVPWSGWLELVAAQMGELGEAHPLWPVQHFLGPSSLSSPAEHGEMMAVNDGEVAAVQRSLQYLLKIGFITLVPGEFGTVSADAMARS
ncbi:non-ribosomal peptide synthetase [Apiospora marii]|uniref:Non-ribosomal peptide synthetase n=1 Tax=Apiospora marii TaxID=335849 RepID=A0ABR1SRF5_9PEZI